ncbi:MAG: hypothetical protein KY466_02525 [Gemmatimonadetes bacterium]|nr:hypothetical protein [Gemmatimonadota bacterium]
MMLFHKWGRSVLALGLALGATACDEQNPFEPVDAPVVTVEYDEATAAINLSWSAVANADTYNVRRSVNGGAFAGLAEGLAATSYVDPDVSAGNRYDYIVVAVGEEDTESSDSVGISIGRMEAALSGPISADRQLSADTTYYLTGVVTVEDGATLSVEAGTLILADAMVQPTALIIEQGGRIDAQGTADAPIVFTSSKPAGERTRGDWGGVVINGRAQCNFPNQDDCIAEGFAAQYGGNLNDDDSGTMRYVRIEFAGYEVSLGNELNLLTMNGVGSGTTLEYIQVHQGLDDGFEWFGGTVDLKYAVASGASDDSFDYSTGWQGRGQFWIALQDPNDADNGFEVDNNDPDTGALPRTDPTIYNITLVGKGATGTAGESTRGLLFRLGTAGEVRNAIVIGFGTAGLDIDGTETAAECENGGLVVSNSIFFGNAAYLDPDSDTHETACVSQPGWTTLLTGDPMLADPYNWGSPDFQPQAGSPAAVAANAATPPATWFTATSYIGAVDPAATGTLWYEGWTTFEKALGQN